MADKDALLRDHAAALRKVEARIESQLQDDTGTFRDYPEVHALLSAAAEGAGQRRAALTEYLGGADGRPDHHKDATFVHDPTRVPGTILNRHIAEFGNAATAYTVLTELAFRFYDLPLRELAPKHLKAYVSLSYAALRLMPGVVAQGLAMQGLFCQCVCPMCGLGACACITVGRQHVETAWRDAVAIAAAAEGFRLHAPRPGSPLSMAGVESGDVLIAVDGHQATSVADIQAAIRKHAIGDKVPLLIKRNAEPPREISVPHTSDNPKK